jgi:hypothetical protein
MKPRRAGISNLFNFVCPRRLLREGQGGGQAPAGGGAAAAAPRGQGGGQRGGTPDRSTWHAEPVKVFDLYFWPESTPYGLSPHRTASSCSTRSLILIEDEVDASMKKMGLDPAKIKLRRQPLTPIISAARNSFRINTGRRSTCPRTGMSSINQQHETETRHGRHQCRN